MFADIDKINPDFVRKQLNNRQAQPYIFPEAEMLIPGPARPASILIPLIRNKNRWELLFIRRTTVDGDHHSGQVAFPGGREDDGDRNPVETALREAKEEIGIQAEAIEVLGQLEYMVTITNYRVTPIVGVVDWPLEIRPQASEVERVFSIPLGWLADNSNRRTEYRQISASSEKLPVLYYDEYEGELLWGVTAHIVSNFLEALQNKATK